MRIVWNMVISCVREQYEVVVILANKIEIIIDFQGDLERLKLLISITRTQLIWTSSTFISNLNLV